MFDVVIASTRMCSSYLRERLSRHRVVCLIGASLGIGFYMGPQGFNAIYSARSGDTLRRNAMLLPFYQLLLSMMIFAGLAAALIKPGLKGTAVDQSFMLVVQHYYPSWVLGLIAGAGALAALIPASALLLAGASSLTKNVAGDARPGHQRLGANHAYPHAGPGGPLLALLVWLVAQRTVVELLLLYYNGITQFAPGSGRRSCGGG